jgi:hypothetical protein
MQEPSNPRQQRTQASAQAVELSERFRTQVRESEDELGNRISSDASPTIPFWSTSSFPNDIVREARFLQFALDS